MKPLSYTTIMNLYSLLLISCSKLTKLWSKKTCYLHVNLDQKISSFWGYIIIKSLLTLCHIFVMTLNSISIFKSPLRHEPNHFTFCKSKTASNLYPHTCKLLQTENFSIRKAISHIYNLELNNVLHETLMWWYMLLIYRCWAQPTTMW